MALVDTVVINTIFILFPLFGYFLLSIYTKDIGFKLDNLVFDLAVFTSLYLMFSFGHDDLLIKLTMLTIPLLIVYLKQKVEAVLIISVIVSIYYYVMGINCGLILFEFGAYYIIFKIIKKEQLNNCSLVLLLTLIKGIVIIYLFSSTQLLSFNVAFSNSIILLINYYLSVYVVFVLLNKCEEIESLHLMARELEEQKQFRESLFKITHEIKNPIAVCRGYLEMLNIEKQEQVAKYIPIIKQEIDRSITLMADFLELTKLKVAIEPMNITLLLDDITEIAKALIKKGKVQLRTNYFTYPVYITGDYNRLKQVLLNLCKNANESIKGNVGIIEIKALKVRRKLIIKIIDNGEGMDRSTLRKLGQPYFTLKEGGTGLGVRFSKEILEMHKGTLTYKSKKGKGTMAIITLPLLSNDN